MEAFVYCWTDHLTKKLYVGSHKGTVDDGYICSSKVVLLEISLRPNDFTRQIIATGAYVEMRSFEAKILRAANARTNLSFYNMHNGDGKFFNKGGYKLKTRSAEHCRKISDTKRGKTYPKVYEKRRSYVGKGNPNYSKVASKELLDKLSQCHKTKLYSVNGKIYNCLADICDDYKLNSNAVAHYRIKSSSSKFAEWKYA